MSVLILVTALVTCVAILFVQDVREPITPLLATCMTWLLVGMAATECQLGFIPTIGLGLIVLPFWTATSCLAFFPRAFEWISQGVSCAVVVLIPAVLLGVIMPMLAANAGEYGFTSVIYSVALLGLVFQPLFSDQLHQIELNR